jgi:hypothetical protein
MVECSPAAPWARAGTVKTDVAWCGISAIPAETHPLSAAAAGVMAGNVSTDQYLWGLRKVLDGITRAPATGFGAGVPPS